MGVSGLLTVQEEAPRPQKIKEAAAGLTEPSQHPPFNPTCVVAFWPGLMDPATAFGLATSVIAVVDFASKVLSKTYRIYSSTNSAVDNDFILESIAKNFGALSNDASLWNSSQPRWRKSAAEKQLAALNHDAQEVAQKLFDATTKLMSMPRTTRWQSFVHALKSVWNEGDIRLLEENLDRIRKQVDTALLMCLRYVCGCSDVFTGLSCIDPASSPVSSWIAWEPKKNKPGSITP